MLGNNLKFSFIKTYSNVQFQVFSPKYCLSCQINCFQRIAWQRPSSSSSVVYVGIPNRKAQGHEKQKRVVNAVEWINLKE